MPSKEKYCFDILKSHSLLVDFEGNPRSKKVPEFKEGETFKQWKKRVLGDKVNNVVIYSPKTPDPQENIMTLKDESRAIHLFNMFKAFNEFKNSQKEKAVKETEHELITFPKDMLKRIIKDKEPPTTELANSLRKFLNSDKKDIDTEGFLMEFYDKIHTYAGYISGLKAEIEDLRKRYNVPSIEVKQEHTYTR